MGGGIRVFIPIGETQIHHTNRVGRVVADDPVESGIHIRERTGSAIGKNFESNHPSAGSDAARGHQPIPGHDASGFGPVAAPVFRGPGAAHGVGPIGATAIERTRAARTPAALGCNTRGEIRVIGIDARVKNRDGNAGTREAESRGLIPSDQGYPLGESGIDLPVLVDRHHARLSGQRLDHLGSTPSREPRQILVAPHHLDASQGLDPIEDGLLPTPNAGPSRTRSQRPRCCVALKTNQKTHGLGAGEVGHAPLQRWLHRGLLCDCLGRKSDAPYGPPDQGKGQPRCPPA